MVRNQIEFPVLDQCQMGLSFLGWDNVLQVKLTAEIDTHDLLAET